MAEITQEQKDAARTLADRLRGEGRPEDADLVLALMRGAPAEEPA